MLAQLRAAAPLEAMYLLPIARDDVDDAVGRLFALSLIERIDERVVRERQYVCPVATGEYVRHRRLFDSPEARARIDGLTTKLRDGTLQLRALAKNAGPGANTPQQAADAMMNLARWAMAQKDHDAARSA